MSLEQNSNPIDNAPLDEDDFEKYLANVAMARAAILKHAGGKLPCNGFLTCPVCDSGRLNYQIHANGHVWVRCSTDGCMAWVE